MSKDTIVHGSIVTPSAKLVGACTVLDSVVRGEITINPRAVLQGVEVDGRGTFYGRVCVVALGAGSEHVQYDHRVTQVYVGPGVQIGAGVRVLGHGEIRGEMTITSIPNGTHLCVGPSYGCEGCAEEDECDPNLQDDWSAP